MSLEYPADLRYLDSHEYIRVDDEIATIGITSFAIEELGDIVFLELPELDDEVEKGDNIGTIESVKAVSEIYAPVSGIVIDRNEMLITSPEMVADDPYNDGWLIKVRLKDINDELEDTLSMDEYKSLVAPEQD